jgi:Flp pilus assembly protein TadG
MFARFRQKLPLLRRFARARRGSAAVEFGIVALPFFLLTIGLAEISMIGFAQTSLDSGVSETARQIRTGRAQMGGLDQQDIKAMLCTEVNRFMVLDCEENLHIDVSRFDSFVEAGADDVNPIQDDEFDPPNRYQPGAPSDIVVVRAYYNWQIMTPLFEPIFENVAGGHRILFATMMFRNEPYQTTGTTS